MPRPGVGLGGRGKGRAYMRGRGAGRRKAPIAGQPARRGPTLPGLAPLAPLKTLLGSLLHSCVRRPVVGLEGAAAPSSHCPPSLRGEVTNGGQAVPVQTMPRPRLLGVRRDLSPHSDEPRRASLGDLFPSWRMRTQSEGGGPPTLSSAAGEPCGPPGHTPDTSTSQGTREAYLAVPMFRYWHSRRCRKVFLKVALQSA